MTQERLVLVAGATGGVGQLTVAKLLEKGFAVRAMTRSTSKAEKMFDGKVDLVEADTRNPATLPKAIQDVTHIICCTGTTAFPSLRWDFNFLSPQSSPQQVDAEGVKNLVAAAPQTLQRFVFISSCGILRKDNFPFKILNAFGVLDAKQTGERAIVNSGLPYTIIRPGRLIDGPYTSYDLNTLLKAKTDGKSAVVLGTGDTLTGDTSRIDVAAACIECLFYPATVGKTFEIVNSGSRPATTNWETLFSDL